MLCEKEQTNPDEIILSNDLCVFLSAKKYLPEGVLEGAGIIITKEHVTNPFDLNQGQIQSIFDLLKLVKLQIDSIYKPDGYNIGWNVGEVGGQNLEHAHLHVLPRYSDEPLAGKGMRYALKQANNRRIAE